MNKILALILVFLISYSMFATCRLFKAEDGIFQILFGIFTGLAGMGIFSLADVLFP